MSATAEVTRGINQKVRTSGAVSLRIRVRTRLRRHKLDRELASGVDPNINPLCCERARELVGEQNRKRIAASLEQLLGEADSGPRAFTSRVPIARAAIRDSRGYLDTIVELLRTPAYISAQGVARISLLLSDGAGPLYGNNPAHSEELRRALETVVDTIDQSTP
jgi:hypothetical protein